MKKLLNKIFISLILFTLIQSYVFGQCTNTTSYGSATAPTDNTPVTITTVQYESEYNTISNVVAGETYQSSSDCGSYITVRRGTYDGTVVAHGWSPLSWTATVSGTYYIHYNTDAACGTASTFCTTTITCTSCSGGGSDPCASVISIADCGAGNAVSYTGGGTGSWNQATSSACGYWCEGVEQIYSFVAPETGTYSIQITAASGYVDYMWQAGTCAETGWTCIDDLSSTGQYGSMNWTAGTTYYLLLDDEDNTTGTHTFYINCPTPTGPPPANDECVNAILVPVNPDQNCANVVSGTIENATASTQAIGACGGTADDDVWYSFVATGTSHYISLLNIAGSTTDMYHAVYSGTCGSLTNLICSDAETSSVTGLTPGTTYYIRVYSWTSTAGQTSTFDVCVANIVPPPECFSSEPFCTSDAYTFPAATDVTSLGDIGCLYTTPNPAWYFMEIDQPGDITINISSGADVDFIAWGPYTDLTDACSTIPLTTCATCPNNTTDPTFYPFGEIVDCSYDSAAEETCNITGAQTGEVYVLLITNYANIETDIDFEQTAGAGSTNCDIVAPPISNNGPLCVGDNLELYVSNPTAGATYTWSGPNGFTSTTMEPTINNVSTLEAGTYSMIITVAGVDSDPVTTDVEINPIITPTFNALGPFCQGDAASGLSLTSIEGVAGTWSPSSISTASIGTDTYTFTPDPGECATTQTMDIEIIDCAVVANCPDYANAASSPNEHCSNQTYYFVVPNTDCSGNIYFDVVGNYGDSWGDEITWDVTSNLTTNVIASGGPGTNGLGIFTSVGPIDPNTEGTTFTLTVYDSFGDGFATNGYIVIEQDGAEICAQISGDFGSEAHVMFMPTVLISPATITITTPSGDVTQTVTNCNDFSVPITINNSLFCSTTTVNLPFEVTCQADASVLASGTHSMTIYPNTPNDISDIVNISYDPANCEWVMNWQNDCDLTDLGDIFDITPDPTLPTDACTALTPQSFTLQYNGISGGLACCNTAGPSVPYEYTMSENSSDVSVVNCPFGGVNNAAYMQVPASGIGGNATAMTLTFDMTGYCFEHPLLDPTDFWVTIIIDGIVVYDIRFFDPTNSASITLDLADVSGYTQNSIVEIYVYPNTFSAGGYNTTYIPGGNCGPLTEGEWTASSFDVSIDVTFDQLAPTPITCSYNVDVNQPCCNVYTVADDAQTICSGEAFDYSAWQTSVEAANSTCVVYSSVTPVGGSVAPDNTFPDGINGTAATIVQTVSAYAYCDANGSGTVNAGDTYTLLSTYELTVNPISTPTFTQLGPFCLDDTPPALPGISTNGISGTWSPSTISTSSDGTTVYTFTPTAGQCATTTTMSIVVNICCPTVTCPADINLAACNEALPTGANTLPDFVSLGGTYTNATSVSYSDATVNGCSTVTTRTYSVSNATCTVTCDQIITRVVDVTNPTGTAPADVAVECSGDVPGADITAITDEDDNCTTNPTVTHQGDVSDGGSCPEIITRTYRITDDCGNYTDVTQTITIDDTQAPIITGTITDQPANALGTCIYQVPDVTGLVSATDNCTLTAALTITQSPTAGTEITANTTVTITMADECGNTATTTANIIIPTALTASITALTNQNCATPGSATVEGADGMVPYTYIWPAGAGGVVDGTASSLMAGNYDVTVLDFNGCSVVQPVSITDIGGFTANATVNANVLCYGQNQGEIELDILGGTADYDIDWGSGTATESTTNYIITGLTANNYDITITDVNSCQAVVNATITEPTELLLSETLTSHVDVDCFGNSTGQLEVAGTGGTTGYLYSLNGGTQQASGLFTGLAAATYTLEVEDNNGCTENMNITITEPTALTISEVLASHVDVDCFGNSTGQLEIAGAGGTIGYLYSLNGGTQQASGLFTGLAAATYTLEVEDNNGCAETMSITITEPTDLTISEVLASHVDVDCFGNSTGQLEVAGAGGTTGYLYSLNGGTQQASGLFTGLAAATYTLEVEDNNGCTENMSITITEPTQLTASITALTDQICATPGSATVEGANGTPTYTYAWPSNADGVVNGTASILEMGSYIVTVYDHNMCSITQTVDIDDIGALNATASVASSPLCYGSNEGSIDVSILTGTANYTITWSTGTDVTSTGNYTITNLTDGLYEITVTDVNSCQTTVSATITEPTDLTISEVLASHINVDCFGNSTGQLEVSGTGGTTGYLYSLNGGTQQASGLFTGLAAATYTLEVEDNNGCTETMSITITEPTALTISEVLASHVDVDCFGNSTGALQVVGDGGSSGYLYSLNNGTPQTSGIFTGLAAANYLLEVEDNNGCTASMNITITEPTALTITELTASHVDVDCYGNNTGSFVVTALNGTPQYLYSIDGGAQNQTGIFTNLTARTYSVEVEDAHGCTENMNIEITQPDELQINLNATPANCGITGGSINATITGGTPAYDLDWSITQTGNPVTNLEPGNYTLNVTDAKLCTSTASIEIGIAGNINAAINEIQPISCYGETDGVLESVSNNGQTPQTHIWNPSATGPTQYDLSAGTYTVTITDAWGCTGSASATLTEPNEMSIDAIIKDITCNGYNDGKISVSVSQGTPNYSYQWNTNDTISQLVNLSVGDYNLTVTDRNGCSINKSYSITQPDPLVLNSQIKHISCYGYTDGSILMNATGGNGSYSYSIFDGNVYGSGAMQNSLSAGTYTLIVTDVNNCEYQTDVLIMEPAELTASYISYNPSCIGNNDGYIDINVIGGTQPYLFGWNENYLDFPLISGLTEGNYNIVISDSNNCVYNLGEIILTDNPVDCIQIPNAFTPNGDGPNDTWIIENLEIFPGAYVYVYNRWGQELWVGRPGDEWDGQYNGKFVPASTYLYIINLYNGSDPYTGTVTVVY